MVYSWLIRASKNKAIISSERNPAMDINREEPYATN